jgi:hypothetical protein
VIDAPAVVVPEVQPSLGKAQGRSDVAAAEAVDRAGMEGKREPAGEGRTGRGTEPGKVPGKPGCTAPTALNPLGAGAAEDAVVPSVPKAPSWRD